MSAAREVVAVQAPPGDALLDVLPRLSQALNGDGPALALHAPGTVPAAAVDAGARLAEAEDDAHDPTVAVVATSGSTGGAKAVLLPASALLASASATHDRLGGPGRWLLALPAQHVAGLQVLVRSLVGRTRPVVLDTSAGFSPEAFADAVAGLRGPRRYTSLVPTQLTRLLDAAGAPLAALAGLDAVLVGGAALPPSVRERAAGAGVRVVTTYGMSETCGGCVYDGLPLDGVEVRLGPGDGRIALGGPVVARGYRGRPDDPAFGVEAGVRWHTTQDAGARTPDGLLAVLGRLDDVIVTGGVNVAPATVEEALSSHPDVAEAVAFGVDDAEWGRRVVVAVVAAPGAAPTLDVLREHVRLLAGAAAAPRQLLLLDRLPLLGPGKPDRATLRRRASGGRG